MNMTVTSPAADVSDPVIPSLGKALDPELVHPALQLALRLWRRDISDVELCSIRLIRHKPGRRALIEYQVSLAGPNGAESLTLLGKIRAKGLDKKTPEMMTQLHRAGFDAGSAHGASVPEVIGKVTGLQMWLQKKFRAFL